MIRVLCVKRSMKRGVAVVVPAASNPAPPTISISCSPSISCEGWSTARLYSTLPAASTPSAFVPSLLLRSNPISPYQHQHQHPCAIQSSRRHKSVFVSRHNQSLQITVPDIMDCFALHGISTAQARTTADHVILKECPFCTKPTQNKADNFYKCYIQIGGGAHFCHRCGAKGSWFDLKLKLKQDGGMVGGHVESGTGLGGGGMGGPPTLRSGYGGSRSSGSGTVAAAGRTGHRRGGTSTPEWHDFIEHRPNNHSHAVPALPMPPPRLTACYTTDLLDRNQKADKTTNHASTTTTAATATVNVNVLEYLTEERGLTTKTLRKYGVGKSVYSFMGDNGQWVKADCVAFPWLMSVSDIEYQEDLRGAKFQWTDPNTAVDTPTTTATTKLNSKEEEEEEDRKTATKGTKSQSTKKKTSKKKLTAKEMVEALEIQKAETFLTRRIKVRAIENKAWQRLDPAGGGWGLFGYHTVPADASEIIVTEGEYDAMAVWQATGRPAVSLPNGCRSLPVEVLPLLERFEKVYLWMDNDAPGHEGAEQFAKKLGLQRCYIVEPNKSNAGEDLPKDANEALLNGLDLEKIIQDATLISHERVLTFGELRTDVLHEIVYPDKYVGTPMTSLPGFTKIIKGLRRGELTVLTGPTGSGKTTFLGQLSLDLAEQDVNVLWGSFEIKNTRLMHKLLQQFARNPLPSGDPSKLPELEAIADKFQQLPLHFMKFHGGTQVEDVLDAMDYSVYVNDVEHIILDNMQFMISRQGTNSSSSFDKFDIQDVAIEKFRKFATERNVHVTLVVHPRKEQENSQLSISSFYGSAKATQEADTVLILQANGNRKFLDVKKNRFNGDLGHTALHFDRKSGRYTEDPLVNGFSSKPQIRKAAATAVTPPIAATSAWSIFE